MPDAVEIKTEVTPGTAGAVVDTKPAAGAGAGAGAVAGDAEAKAEAKIAARIAAAEAEAERRMLKALGVDKVDDAKSALKAKRDADEASKSAQQKLEERLKLAEPEIERAKSLHETLEKHAKTRLKTLPDEVRAHVKSLAGDDPQAILRQIDSLEESGLMKKLLSTGADGKVAEDTRAPANSAARNGQPPAAVDPTKPKRFRDLTREEQARAEAEFMGQLAIGKVPGT